jgi:hypothetical protein
MSKLMMMMMICLTTLMPDVLGLIAYRRNVLHQINYVTGEQPGSIHVGSMVDKVALGQVFLRVLRFPPVNV